MKKRFLSLLLALILTLTLLPTGALASAPAVDTDQDSYVAGSTVNVLLSANSDLMLEVFRGDAATGIKLISSATSGKAYSFKTGSGWAAGTYTVVVGAGSNMASCTFGLTASGGTAPQTQSVYLTVWGPDSVLFGQKSILYSSGMTAYSLLLFSSGLSVGTGPSGNYVSAISDYAEFAYGSSSGWMYSVNGSVPMVAASDCTLSPCDSVLWYYSKNGTDPSYNTASGGAEAEGQVAADSTGTATIAADRLSEIISAGKGLTVSAQAGSALLTAQGVQTLSEKLGTAEKLTITLAKTEAAASKFTVVSNSKTLAALDVSMTAGDTEIKSGFGVMTISIAVGDAYKNQTLSILHLKDDGSYEVLSGKVNSDGALSFEVSSLSTFVVMVQADLPVEYRFADITAGQWYVPYIQHVYEKGLMTGSGGSFAPAETITRAMLVTVLYRMAGSPSVNGKSSFSDASDSGAWYYNAVLWASANGVAGGYGNGLFGVTDTLTREQLVTIFYRYAQLKGYDVSSGANKNLLSFDDSGSIAFWAYPAFRWAVAEGLVSGTSAALLSPLKGGTRAETAAVITRFGKNIAA